MKLLLVVFLLTVLPTLCFGQKIPTLPRCHFCGGHSITECDASSIEEDCLTGLAHMLQQGGGAGGPEGRAAAKAAAARARAGRTTGTENFVCLKMRVTGEKEAFIRMCGVAEGDVDTCTEENDKEEKTVTCNCMGDLCNTGDVPKTVPTTIKTTPSKTSGSGKPKLTSLTLWVVIAGFVSLVYL